MQTGTVYCTMHQHIPEWTEDTVTRGEKTVNRQVEESLRDVQRGVARAGRGRVLRGGLG